MKFYNSVNSGLKVVQRNSNGTRIYSSLYDKTSNKNEKKCIAIL